MGGSRSGAALRGSGGQWKRLRAERFSTSFRSAPTLLCALPKDQHSRTWRADLLFSGCTLETLLDQVRCRKLAGRLAVGHLLRVFCENIHFNVDRIAIAEGTKVGRLPGMRNDGNL